jgi:uncharacterized protein (DUF4415 family)
MFHVGHFVDASMYVHQYAYNDRQVKQGERIRRRKIARLEASAWYRPAKRQVCLRLDADVLAWFKRAGRGYQTRINLALREVMREERSKLSLGETNREIRAYRKNNIIAKAGEAVVSQS